MKKLLSLITLCILGLPNLALAGELKSADTAWILTATALVLFMTLPGLSMFYAGLVRSKNVLSVFMQCFAITCLMSILWFIAGYTIAFGSEGVEPHYFIGDWGNLFFSNITIDSVTGTIPTSLFAAFQMTFAIITPALIVGGFAERMRFSAMLVFSALWMLIVYAPVCHWVWGGGWLQSLGLQDFAGGTVVHITAAVAALVAAMYMGNRKGYGTTAMPPHNLTMTVAGAGMLWVGWFGFNAGSALAANSNAAMALLVTHLSASAGALAWMSMEWKKYGKPSVLGVVTGMVAGLGTITPAAGSVSPAAALIIGSSAGIICFFATNFLKQKLKIDDSLDVFPVHGVGGILGTLLAGVFCSPNLGLFSGNGFTGKATNIIEQLGIQALGIISVFTYTAIITLAILKLVDLIIGLRVNDDEETEGLDLILHDERGYDL